MKVVPFFLSFLAGLAFAADCATNSASAVELPVAVLKNLSYRNLAGIPHAIRLSNGHWRGEPTGKGAVSLPTVELVGDFAAYGDLDGDGIAEAVVLLHSSSGGSGVFSSVAVVSSRNGQPVNVATQFVGDRVQVRDITIQDQRIIADMVVAAPTDPACCPSQKVQVRWKLSRGLLIQVASIVLPGRVGIADIGSGGWRLAEGVRSESLPNITLAYRGGRLVGFGGCNQYFMGVSDGALPGQIAVSSPAGATRKACEEAIMARENSFFGTLANVTRFGFVPGGLVMAYDNGRGARGMLAFSKSSEP